MCSNIIVWYNIHSYVYILIIIFNLTRNSVPRMINNSYSFLEHKLVNITRSKLAEITFETCLETLVTLIKHRHASSRVNCAGNL